MNAEQYAAYKTDRPDPATHIHIADLDNGDHTLAYGYTCDRDTWHAYVMGAEIHVVTYTHTGERLRYMSGGSLLAEELRPNKRVYPDTVNDTFARLMRDTGNELPFIGTFDFGSPDVTRRAGLGAFKGKTHLDL